MNSQPKPNKETVVVIPTYNESFNIAKIILELAALNLDILVVDDNSPDGTSEIVENVPTFGKSTFLLKRSGKLGLGSAYREGFNWAIENQYKYVVEMDADFSHTISDLIRLLSHKEDYSLIIGSRYVEGGTILGWSKKRYWLSFLANKYSKVLTFSPVKDMTSGFRIYRTDILHSIDFANTKCNGYGFQIEMTVNSLNKKITILEVPICFNERRVGNSKMNIFIILEAITSVLRFSVIRVFNILKN